MTQAQIDRWRERFLEMWHRRDVMPDEIVAAAEAVGRRKRRNSKVYSMDGRPPLPIHVHPFPLKKTVKKKSLEILQDDLEKWQMRLPERRLENGNV